MAASAYQNAGFRYMIIMPEVTPGTAVPPTTAERIIKFRDIKSTTEFDVDDESAKYQDGTHAEDLSAIGTQKGVVTCSLRCNVGAANSTPPAWWTVAKMCGYGLTSAYATDKGIGLVSRNAYDNITYTVYVSDVTIGASQIHTYKQYAGCMGNMTIGVDKVGGVWTANFNIFGKLNDIVDAAEIAITAPSTVQPQVYLSHAFSINGVAEKVSSWKLDAGNVIKPVTDQSDATGISHYVITEKHPRFSCNPLSVKQATKDWWAEALAKPTTNNLVTNTPATGKLSISAADMQCLSMAQAEVEGLSAYALNFKLLPNGVPGTLLDASLTYEDTHEILSGTRS